MGNSLLAVREINHKYIVVVKGKGFGETIALIEDAAKQEISFIADAMKNERDVLEKARKELERI